MKLTDCKIIHITYYILQKFAVVYNINAFVVCMYIRMLHTYRQTYRIIIAIYCGLKIHTLDDKGYQIVLLLSLEINIVYYYACYVVYIVICVSQTMIVRYII